MKTFKQLFLGLFLIAAASSVLLISDWIGKGGLAPHGRVDSVEKLHRKVKAGEQIKIAILAISSSSTQNNATRGLVDALAEKGFKDGEKISLKFFNAEGDTPTAVNMAQAAIGGDYDLVLTISTAMLQTVANANKNGQALHIFGTVTDPFGAGVGISRENPLNHPAWLTGYGTFQPVREAIILAKKLFPDLQKVGTVVNSSEACSQACHALAEKTCAELGIELVTMTVSDSASVYEASSALASKGIQLFVIGGDVTVETAFNSVVKAADAAGIPVIGYSDVYAGMGALVGIGASYYEVGRMQGYLTADIMNGLSPAQVPVKDMMPLSLSLNYKVLEKFKDKWSIPPDVDAQAAIVFDRSGEMIRNSEKRNTAGMKSSKQWDIHFLNYVDAIFINETINGVRRAFDNAGLKEGTDYDMTISNAHSDIATLSSMVDNAISQNADMIILTSTPTLQAVIRKVKDIPVIFATIANPVEAGAGKSDQDHLLNVTGISSTSAFSEAVKVLRECMPNVKRVGSLVNPSESNSVYNLRRTTEELAALGIELVSAPVSTPSEITEGIQALLGLQVEAVLQIVSNIFNSSFSPISKACLEAKTPLFGFTSDTASDGGAVVAIARDYMMGGEDAGKLAIRVMNGESPARIPFAPISKTIITVNMKNAARYGLKIPQSLLDRADVVIPAQ